MLYATELGQCHHADSLELLHTLSDASVDLVFTSPPYALTTKKAYGNVDAASYVDWFLPFARQIHRILKPSGSFVLNIGPVYNAGLPTHSLYHYRLLLALCDTVGFHLAQEFFWHNTAKMPSPAVWVTVRRIRVKDAVEPLFWLSKEPFPKAHNGRVLAPYSSSMKSLIRRGIASQRRPSGHSVEPSIAKDNGGAIPSNVLACGHTESNSDYLRRCRDHGIAAHPARFPSALPEFFVQFLTEPGDLVVDPFAGSNTTGAVAERMGRRWIAIEKDRGYALASALQFGALSDAMHSRKVAAASEAV